MNERKKIPYGITDFKLIQDENYYYVDKTDYIPRIEAAGRYLSLIRPRRFGRSLLLVVLECYYDLAARDEFDPRTVFLALVFCGWELKIAQQIEIAAP